MLKYCLLLATGVTFVLSSSTCGAEKKSASFMKHKTTEVIAHRGAWKNTGLPENSVAALKAAIDGKYYGSEMDVHMTDDGFIVVNHDPHFHDIDIQRATLAQLRLYRLDNGEALPLLSDFLEVITRQRATKLIIEIKTSQRGAAWGIKTTDKVMQEVAKYKASSHVEYISFGFDICQRIKENAPQAAVQYLNGDKSPEEIKQAGLDGIDYHYSVFQQHPGYLSQSKKLGVITNVWTVDDPVIMDWLIAQSADFITTNEPELVTDRIGVSPLSNGYSLNWSDEFLYEGLPDASKWSYQSGGGGWGNNERQFYTDADTNNAVVRKGRLNIIVLKQTRENHDYTSARLVTRGKASWTYGRIEARIKLPEGKGLWPAFWMLGDAINKTGWPDCGEIDIMEHVGYQPDSSWGTVHTKAFNHIKGTQKGSKTYLAHPYDRFHVYAIEWTPENIRFFVDDKPFFQFNNQHKSFAEWPFDSPAYIVLNVAVGGNLGGKEGIDQAAFPATMQVDYVRVFQKK